MLPQILTSWQREFVKVFLKTKGVEIILLEDIVKLEGVRI